MHKVKAPLGAGGAGLQEGGGRGREVRHEVHGAVSGQPGFYRGLEFREHQCGLGAIWCPSCTLLNRLILLPQAGPVATPILQGTKQRPSEVE